jgi:hypothetical protein
MLDWIKNQARRLDTGVQDAALRSERIARIRKTRENAQWARQTAPDAVARELRDQGIIDDAGMVDAVDRLKQDSTREAYIRSIRGQMNRGPFMKGEMGVREGLNHAIANNAVVRRGVLPVAVGGGGLMAGAAVTTGAQNLMALMDFMQSGQEQQARVEQSPLA